MNLQKNPKEQKCNEPLREAAEAYANTFPNNERRDLLYQGETGVGKTYLLNCIGGRVLERGYSVLKISAYKLIQLTLDNLRNEPSERPDYILPDLLIIDDLGTEPMIRNITIETLLSIVCERQDLDKATIIATNLAVTDEDGVDTLQPFTAKVCIKIHGSANAKSSESGRRMCVCHCNSFPYFHLHYS